MTAADYRRRLKSAQPPLTGAFLFCGGEEYLKRNALESTRAAVVGEGDAAAFNLHRYSALDAAFRFADLAGALDSPPFFADRKLLELHDFPFDSASESQLAALENLLREGDFSDTVLILYAKEEELDTGTPKRPGKALLRFGKLCEIVLFEKETPARLAGWIARHFAAEQIECTSAQCSMLLERCGSSMFLLSNEIAKLCAYVKSHGRSRLEDGDIAALVSSYTDSEGFAFSNSILSGTAADAYAILGEMKARRERPELILATLSGIFSDMVRIAALSEGSLSLREISERLKIHEYKISLMQHAMRGKTSTQLLDILALCADADRRIKTSAADSYIVLERLIAAVKD